MVNPWLILAVAAAVAVAGLQGYRKGYSASEAAHAAATRKMQQEIFDAGERVSREAARLEAERNNLNDLARRLEDEAREDADGDRPGVGAAGMQRIKRRWSAARSATGKSSN